MSGCLGGVLAALVDGELDHAAREKAHRHLAHCALCRAEVEAQRRLKASLSRTRPAEPSTALLARLHALPTASTSAAVPAPVVRTPVLTAAVPAPALAARSHGGSPRAGTSRLLAAPVRPLLPALVRSGAPGGPSTRPSPGRPAARPVPVRRGPAVLSRRRGVAGSAFAVLGVAAALALGAPPQRAVPATNGSGPAVLVTQVSTTGRAPAAGLVGAGLTSVPGSATAVQVVRRPEVPVRVASSAAVGRSTR